MISHHINMLKRWPLVRQSINHRWIIKSAKFIWNDNHLRLSHSNHITNFPIQ